MEILAGIAIWLVAESMVEMLSKPGAWLLRPLKRALQSAYGGRVLAAVWLACGGWFWLAWQFGVHGEPAWANTVFVLSVLCAPGCALLSLLVWYHRNDPPGRRRGSAY